MSARDIHKILVPVDLSSCSRAGLELACSLAIQLSACIEVLLVQEPERSSGPELAIAKRELQRFIATVPDALHTVLRERVEVGEARERIVAIAEAGGFDALVLGTHGLTGRAHSLAGSVAESVVRTASCPVFTVRERD